MQLITMTAYRRPDYTRQVLDALAKCRGIGDWLLLPSVEPGDDGVRAAFESWSACESRPQWNAKRLGLNANTRSALERARALKPTVVVHLEDDTVPSHDALDYFAWAVREIVQPKRRGQRNHTISIAAGWNKPATAPTEADRWRCLTRKIWTTWGWAVDASTLNWLLVHWCPKNPRCFSCKFKETYSATRNEVFPVLSRIQNIGYEMGENRRTPQWYRDHHRAPWVAGELPPGEFVLEGGR